MKTPRIVLVATGLFLCAMISLPLVMGQAGDVNPTRPLQTYMASPEVPWVEVGLISSTVAYPSVGERDCTTCDANTALIIWKIPNGASSGMLRFDLPADADTATLQILCAAGASGQAYNNTRTLFTKVTDDYVYGGQLALTCGKQVARASRYYADTCTATNGVLTPTVLDSGNDRVVIITFDTMGFKEIAFLATALSTSADVRVWSRWW